MKILGSRGTHENDGNRQVHPMRIPAGCANTSFPVFGAAKGAKSARLALNDFYFKFPDNQKLRSKIFLVIPGEQKIPERLEPVRARLLP